MMSWQSTCAISLSFTPSYARVTAPLELPPSFSAAFSMEYDFMVIGSLLEYLSKSPFFTPFQLRMLSAMSSTFFPLIIECPTGSPSPSEKTSGSHFYREEIFEVERDGDIRMEGKT
ncbi:uncharacterized protein G2W53_041771 [Senna tora]|uniref:Uncharacterized protein n=1 Tax=Senna tora TaxID=362788 RepID=A0A834SEA5_9FABA|nr:uncharacterized protein G2W53_041771 [Senna tora]